MFFNNNVFIQSHTQEVKNTAAIPNYKAHDAQYQIAVKNKHQ